ncbi:hypothetical protein PoB_006639500 [Plakobranchus ocellatus]|uniref:Uncharacterized protein n=1 Tax=Plakobranchus ocellatus TaxID=259542 RepID=A0AAV4D755_9GAST|nr:hypothetical protein PoB_006639500 [Plakobranchus ocellatus]
MEQSCSSGGSLCVRKGHRLRPSCKAVNDGEQGSYSVRKRGNSYSADMMSQKIKFLGTEDTLCLVNDKTVSRQEFEKLFKMLRMLLG